MKLRIGINGFGRIGRKILRLALEHKDITIVGINDLSQPEQIAHLLSFDSVHGRLPWPVTLEGTILHVRDQKIPLFCSKDPAQIPWKDLDATFVHECTGVFLSHKDASKHLQAGAQHVLISAPSPDPDATICMGVNHTALTPNAKIVSNASCTTNALAPLLHILDQHAGIRRGMMLTIHSYTNDQQLLDLAHKDLRRARSATLSQIPTTTGAAKAIGLILPHLTGKIEGLAVRVPTANVSMIDFTGELLRPTTKEAIMHAFQEAARGPLKGILDSTVLPLVSQDFNGSTMSTTIDESASLLFDSTCVKIISWYDNESGFSARMLDLTRYMAGAA